MASLTAPAFFVVAAIGNLTFGIVNGTTIMPGGWQARDGTTGLLTPYTAAAGQLLLGPMTGSPFYGDTVPTAAGGVAGNTSANPSPQASVAIEGGIAEGVVVTGASAATDCGKPVFLASDDHSYTLTRPTRGEQVGAIARWITSTKCDVLLYSLSERLAIGLAGHARTRILLGLIDFASASAATLKTITAPFHGKIMSCYAAPVIACTGSGGTVAIQPKIGGVALTTNGGLTTVSTAASATLGTNNAGAAVTDDGTNEFHEGDSITVVGSSPGGTQTSGLVEFWAVVDYLPGV